ncbi:hypothetical protein NVP1017O_17 [Vibrio phage 1.017.O._10N.286.55.C11]|nr:hypothetical protein NVP1017O_17 [Vibrio phage 1.017.O._10N.286.55.C11]AUR85449.1 hypothetical protein NVP1075O_17 [Vibrio phage 1.075.O._10N.286.55.B10]AUR86995.1 hypothetical protein NVP1093O_17 [Vibrio phage 1.093.O._10N.286.55.E10]AUR87068.1 hypothetical protein NVP1094O_17 [Vibrio phage 1.094.O._10N.286.55.E12]
MTDKCETVGCDNDAEFFDGLHNKICSDCMDMEIAESECEAEDFMTIED